MPIPWDRILDIAVAVGRRIFNRERLTISLVKNQTFGEDGWKIIVANTGHCPSCLIQIRMEFCCDRHATVLLNLPPLLGQSVPLPLEPTAIPYEIAISAYRFAQFGRGPGRYRISIATASRKTFSQDVVVD